MDSQLQAEQGKCLQIVSPSKPAVTLPTVYTLSGYCARYDVQHVEVLTWEAKRYSFTVVLCDLIADLFTWLRNMPPDGLAARSKLVGSLQRP